MATANLEGEKKLIGSGTFGRIYKTNRCGGKGFEGFVAVKEIDLKKCTPKDKQHVLHEAEFMQTCHHENLVKFIESFCRDNCLHIVMELCNKGNLRTLIVDQKGLDEEQFIDTFIQITRGLKYLHDKGVIHRDVKTTNILLHEQNGKRYVKIGDFGLAKVLDMSPTICVGSPYFMSPEMISGKPYDMSTDIWSFGCCAYEMVTTKVPYESNHLESLKRRKNEEQVDSSKIKYCSLMQNLITAMMDNEPTRRPNARRILEFLENHDVTTHKQKRQEKGGRREDFAKTCPPRLRGFDIGYDSSEENYSDEVLIEHLPVKLTKEEKDWYAKAKQLQTDIKLRLHDKRLMEKINEAINRTKHMDDERQFLADVEKILDGPMFRKCKPDLKALWGYQTEIVKKDFKIAF